MREKFQIQVERGIEIQVVVRPDIEIQVLVDLIL